MVIFLFVSNLINVVKDCSEGYEELIYSVTKCESNDGVKAKFKYKDENGVEVDATCTLYDKIDWTGSDKNYKALGKFGGGAEVKYVFYKYKHSGLLLAVARVDDKGYGY